MLDISDEHLANAAAEEIRAAIALVAAEFEMPDRLGTASVGLSNFAADERIGDALQRADSALYAAKTAGRDTVRRFNP